MKPPKLYELCLLRPLKVYIFSSFSITLICFTLFFGSVVKQSIRPLTEVDWGEPAHLREGQASDTPPAHSHWAKVSFIYTFTTLVTKSTCFALYMPTCVIVKVTCRFNSLKLNLLYKITVELIILKKKSCSPKPEWICLKISEIKWLFNKFKILKTALAIYKESAPNSRLLNLSVTFLLFQKHLLYSSLLHNSHLLWATQAHKPLRHHNLSYMYD